MATGTRMVLLIMDVPEQIPMAPTAVCARLFLNPDGTLEPIYRDKDGYVQNYHYWCDSWTYLGALAELAGDER